jgi:hypothetical protein
MNFEKWGDSFTQSFLGVGEGVRDLVPQLIFALIIFAIGWVLATLVEKLVESIFKSLKVDAALKSAGFEDVVKRSGYNLNAGRFVGSLIKWFIIVVFLVASLDVLSLVEVNRFLGGVVLFYLPQVIVAVLFLMVAVIIAEVVQKLVTASSRSAHVKSAVLLGHIAKWAIWIFAVIAALSQLGIAATQLNMLFMGIVIAAALAFGLAFGLGGKEVAGRLLEKAVHTVSDKE